MTHKRGCDVLLALRHGSDQQHTEKSYLFHILPAPPHLVDPSCCRHPPLSLFTLDEYVICFAGEGG